jgi:hypothetical protein
MANLPPAAVQVSLLRVLHRAFVQARNMAMSGNTRHVCDLADTFEVIPELMANWDDTTLQRIREILAEYQSAHADCGYEYVSLLAGTDNALHFNGKGAIVGASEKSTTGSDQ